MTRVIANPVATKTRSEKVSDKFGVFKKMDVNGGNTTGEQIMDLYIQMNREYHPEIYRKEKALKDSSGRELNIQYFNTCDGNDKIKLTGFPSTVDLAKQAIFTLLKTSCNKKQAKQEENGPRDVKEY